MSKALTINYCSLQNMHNLLIHFALATSQHSKSMKSHIFAVQIYKKLFVSHPHIAN